MTLLRVLTLVFAVDLIAIVATALVIIGPEQLRESVRTLPNRVRGVAVPVGVLAVVLLANSVVRDPITETAWIVGLHITEDIYELEGNLVPLIQSFANPLTTTVFSYAYVYGYVYLLVFPLVAYAALEDTDPLEKLAVAYSLNYVIALVCYVSFVAYGPRNLLGGSVESLLYTSHPEFQFLTSEVNSNTNVFPSLHTSLSATVMAIAYDTRETYPVWLPIATVVGLLIIVATMYLGIHWVTDVVGGLVLATIAVTGGRRYVRND